jgi:hypothetical protein
MIDMLQPSVFSLNTWVAALFCCNFSRFTFHDSRTLRMTGNWVDIRIGMIDGRKKKDARRNEERPDPKRVHFFADPFP